MLFRSISIIAIGADDEERVLAEVVEQRARRREEQRQVVLDARGQLRVRDHAIDRGGIRNPG